MDRMEQRRRQAPPAGASPTPIILPGAIGGVAGSVPGAAAGAAAIAAGAGGEAAIAEVAKNGAAAVLAVLARISRRRLEILRERLLGAGIPQTDVDMAIAEEAAREVIYQRRAAQRTRAGMAIATKATDAGTRATSIDALIRREQRFAQMRASAAAERVLASAELEEMRRISPQGAFWRLGKRRTHTADCLAMAGRFWPWSVLDEVHPLLHVGCGCFLISMGAAISQGLMAPGDIPTNAAAKKLAATVIAHVRAEREAERRRYGLEEQATRELAIRERMAELDMGEINELACAPLRCDAELQIESKSVQELDLPPPGTFHLSEAEEQTGAMVALYPDRDEAEKLAITGGLPAHELHVTLAFLGKAKGLDFDKAAAAVKAWAARTPVMKGELSGIGHFDIDGEEKVTYRSVDLPALAPHREQLVKALERAGTPASKDHGFTPHMSLDNKVRRPPIEKQPIVFKHVTLTWAMERHAFALAGK